MSSKVKLYIGSGLTSLALIGAISAGEVKAASTNPLYKPTPNKNVQYNWGFGGPAGFPVDHFRALFDQSGYYSSGDYFIQTLADDAVSVNVDGNNLINRTSSYTGSPDRTLWLGVQSGQHTIKTNYTESTWQAGVFSHIVPLDSWLAYYYPNQQLSGLPKTAKILQPTGSYQSLYQDFGTGSGGTGVPADHFSVRYSSAKRIKAGDYIFRAKADDGVRVYVDGKLVIDQWKNGGYRENAVKVKIADLKGVPANGQDVHWIDVEYYDNLNAGKIEFNIEPFNQAITNTWMAEYYPNDSFLGSPMLVGGANSLSKIADLRFNWGQGAPLSSIPADHFTAKFWKRQYFAEGTYLFKANGDDGIRVYLDDQLVVDAWTNNDFKEKASPVKVSKGYHTIRVEYKENTWTASVNVNYQLMAEYTPPKGNKVEYNWGNGSPAKGIPADAFTAVFDQSGTYKAGDYFVTTLADDGVKVQADGNTLIDRWSKFTGKTDKALWLGVQAGQHDVKTQYFEDGYGAGVFSHIVPLNSWLAYYYPNQSLSGLPTAAKIIPPTGSLDKLSENFGAGSPAAGISNDHYSARYTTAKRIAAGDYIVHAKADDGMRIYVDGKLVLDHWKNGASEEAVKVSVSDITDVPANQRDIHWVEVEYYDNTYDGNVDVAFEPWQDAILNTWVGEFYPNANFEGIPSVIGGNQSTNKLAAINFNWGTNPPIEGFPTDQFSARFTKQVDLETGTYAFKVKADEGVRVYLDDKLIIDSWSNNDGTQKGQGVYVTGGKHTIRVEYYDKTNGANLSFDYEKISANQVFYDQSPQITYNWGTGSPNGLPATFNAVFDQSQTLTKGDYFLQNLSDGPTHVQVDGNEMIASDTDGSGVLTQKALVNLGAGNHQIMTNYTQQSGDSFIYSHVAPFDSWVAYYYPNPTFTGKPAAGKIITPTGTNKALVENNSVPDTISSTNYSAVYRTAKRMAAEDYVLSAQADEAYQVYVDGKLVLDHWQDATNQDAVTISIKDDDTAQAGEKDIHWVEVRAFNQTDSNDLEVSLTADVPSLAGVGMKYVSKVNMPVYRSFEELSDYRLHSVLYNPSYSRYLELGYGDLVTVLEEKSYAAKIQTSDGVIGWVQKDYLESNLMQDLWLVKESRALRNSASSTGTIIGTIPAGAKVYVLKHETTSGSAYTEWYYVQTTSGVKGWIWGAITTSGNSGYDLIKYEFDKVGKAVNQVGLFTPLNTKASVMADQINQFIDYKTGGKKTVMTGMGAAYLKAQEESGLNAVYLLAHSGLETGWGTSAISNAKYNFYAIGAIDSAPDEGAYNYSTPEGGIIAGAMWISEKYVIRPGDTDTILPYYQPTIDNMRWDNSWHQYASDEAWAEKIAANANDFYNYINKR
ncbi:PA14 domain-containing protein [Neobacillus cucumis]|uniref:PA14 domain-containing protein n=1 Tax=Neobacillus cucumis TaxID=1740721 RepID=UPI0028536851|nr:PA14 domain-containing protein [Neobacillus cucumis]MDR4949483.1 PA14 domain-containing protein [Neobacillus cucumis]